MAKVDEVLGDPDFWHQDTTDDDRLFALENNDPKFKLLGRDRQTAWLKERRKTYDANRASQEKEKQGRMEAFAPQAQEQQTIYQRFVAPLTEGVGRAVEMATEPLVDTLAGTTGKLPVGHSVGHGGVAGETRKAIGGAVVPQSPWQAGAMAAQFVPGVGAMSAPLRVGASAAGAGGLQALLGEKGVVEGGGIADVAREGAGGALKGALTQATGEVAGKAIGAARRHQPGAGTLKANSDAARVNQAAGEISPEFARPRTVQEAGAFFQGTQGAQKAAETAFGNKIAHLEAELVKTQGHPYVGTSMLDEAWNGLVRQYGREGVLTPQLRALMPKRVLQTGNLGFTPTQAQKIVALTGERLKASDTAAGHLKNQAMDDLVMAIERAITKPRGFGQHGPMGPGGQLTRAREGYAKSMGVKELLEGMFDPGKGGFRMDAGKLQELLSKSPDLIDQVGPAGLEKLFLAATRGASKGPGFADEPTKAASSLYMPRSGTNILLKSLEKLLGRAHKVGEKPLTVSQGTKQKLGVAATAVTSANTDNERRK